MSHVAMNLDLFFLELANLFDKTPKPEQVRAYRAKMGRFSSDQLIEILNRLLEECKTFPKFSDIYKAAQELGFMQTESASFTPHRWQPTDCRMCRGEGRICVVWLITVEIRNDERKEAHALTKIVPYTQSCDSAGMTLGPGEYRTLFRCACMSGDAVSLPKSWPKWSKSKPGVFYR